MTGVAGRWTHSFEEDHGDVMVYRPADHDLPWPRRRAGIDFAPDGTYVEWVVGREGTRRPVAGRWRAGEGGRIELSGEAGAPQVVEVVLLAPDRLELRRRTA